MSNTVPFVLVYSGQAPCTILITKALKPRNLPRVTCVLKGVESRGIIERG